MLIERVGLQWSAGANATDGIRAVRPLTPGPYYNSRRGRKFARFGFGFGIWHTFRLKVCELAPPLESVFSLPMVAGGGGLR
jgi:hypothetical protein